MYAYTHTQGYHANHLCTQHALQVRPLKKRAGKQSYLHQDWCMHTRIQQQKHIHTRLYIHTVIVIHIRTYLYINTHAAAAAAQAAWTSPEKRRRTVVIDAASTPGRSLNTSNGNDSHFIVHLFVTGTASLFYIGVACTHACLSNMPRVHAYTQHCLYVHTSSNTLVVFHPLTWRMSDQLLQAASCSREICHKRRGMYCNRCGSVRVWCTHMGECGRLPVCVCVFAKMHAICSDLVVYVSIHTYVHTYTL